MFGMSEIYPEVRTDRTLEFEDNTADPNSLQRFVPRSPVLWQIRKKSRDIRRRDRRNHVVRREETILRLNSDNSLVRYRDLLRRAAEVNSAAFRFDCGNQHVNQCLRPAFQIAEFLLHDALPRGANALDPRPDPGRGDRVRIFVEFVLEECLPEAFITILPAPSGYPFFR